VNPLTGPPSDPAGEFVNSVRVPLRAAPESVRVARRITRLACVRWGLEDNAPAAELMVSELVAAALGFRPEAPLVMRLSLLANAMVIAVSSHSGMSPESDDDGLGAQLIDFMADAWGTLPLPDGQLVWARLPLNAASPR
jgi:hypothetical protein